jgi:hypothetical protein
VTVGAGVCIGGRVDVCLRVGTAVYMPVGTGVAGDCGCDSQDDDINTMKQIAKFIL